MRQLRLTLTGRFTPAERDLAGLMVGLGMKPAALSLALVRPRRHLASYVSKGRLSPAPDVMPLDLNDPDRAWTEDEDILLDGLVRIGHRPARIARVLRRPVSAVEQRAAALEVEVEVEVYRAAA